MLLGWQDAFRDFRGSSQKRAFPSESTYGHASCREHCIITCDLFRSCVVHCNVQKASQDSLLLGFETNKRTYAYSCEEQLATWGKCGGATRATGITGRAEGKAAMRRRWHSGSDSCAALLAAQVVEC